MYGLLMDTDHLDKVLKGILKRDRRAFRTRKRGRIALIDRNSFCLKGFAELYDVRSVSYRDYLEQDGRERITGDMWASHRNYYEMCFRNIEKIDPISVEEFPQDGIWAELPDDIGKRKQKSLFDFS